MPGHLQVPRLAMANRQDKACVAAQASALQTPSALSQTPRTFAKVSRVEKAAEHHAALRVEMAS
jgi:hypothetical protein